MKHYFIFYLFGTHHGLLCVLVIRVPANTHHHLVHVAVAHAGPTVVDARADVTGQVLHHTVREVG